MPGPGLRTHSTNVVGPGGGVRKPIADLRTIAAKIRIGGRGGEKVDGGFMGAIGKMPLGDERDNFMPFASPGSGRRGGGERQQ